jgi:membrane protease YdiL (CAAX protease family)
MNDTTANTTQTADAWAIGFVLVFPTALTYVYFTLLTNAPLPLQYLAYALKFVQFGFPLFWFLKVQKRKLSLRQIDGEGILFAIGFGALTLVAMWLLYKYVLLPSGLMTGAGEKIETKIDDFGVSTVGAYAALGVFYALFHSLLEEYYWRWFVFAQLRRLVSMRWSIAISSLGFMAHHVIILNTFFEDDPALAWTFSLAVAAGGAVWAWMYERWPSLLPIWISHMLIDAAIFLIGYDLVF